MRAIVAIVGLAMALSASGCLRTKFDLCAQLPPDPACAYLDAGDAAASDAASVDATSDDAGDAGADDSGVDAP